MPCSCEELKQELESMQVEVDHLRALRALYTYELNRACGMAWDYGAETVQMLERRRRLQKQRDELRVSLAVARLGDGPEHVP